MSDPNLIVGMEHAEDAGVYRLRDDLAIVQTVDFFTPIVDDPYTFGQIAVVNALSDVYAMGARPLTALNIVCFPLQKMEMDVLREILRGGLDKMREAGVLLIGGHSVEDEELKYGLAVTGTIHPQRVLLNRGARPGDRLVLTKPLGTGIASTAIKAGLAEGALVERVIASMTTLNGRAAEIMTKRTDVHACTDITGFGLLGHALEMIEGTRTGLVIDSQSVPYFAGIEGLIREEIIPGGLLRNRGFVLPKLDVAPGCSDWLVDLFFDPQTAGGLLISLPASGAEELLEDLHGAGIKEAAIVGEVLEDRPGRIRVV